MASWRVARGLNTLRDQVDEAAPNRSKLSDGSIGDPAHQVERSDHNPDAGGVVRARDITHDPGDGANMFDISEALRISRDRRIKYVIFNKRIFSATWSGSRPPWTWGPYSGSNPHDKHMHVSVVPTSVADDTSPWEITLPLSNEDIRRVSDATAAKVLGKPWSVPGRTLAGTFEAMLGNAAVDRTTLASITKTVQDTLTAAHNDSETPVVIPEAHTADLAERTVSGVLRGLGSLNANEAAAALVTVLGDERARALLAALGARL